MGLALRLLSKESSCSSARLEVALSSTGVILGRSRDADLAIASGTIARRHAQVVPSADGGAVRVICLGSTNGTKIRRLDGALVAVPLGGELPFEVGERVVLAGEYELELVTR